MLPISLRGALVLTIALTSFSAMANPAHDILGPQKELTPAQKVALPDGGAPPPPDGYTTTEDFEANLQSYSGRVRTHQALGLPGGEAHQSTAIPNDAPSHFSIFGMPVKFNAPVRPPYESSSYQNYAGSPGNGQTSVITQADAASTAKWNNNQHLQHAPD